MSFRTHTAHLGQILRRSFRQGLICAATVFVSTSTQAQFQAPPTNECRGGYRYAFIREVGDRVQFHACRRILEPSSRPVDCQMFGEIETAEVRKKLKATASSFIAGYAVGLTCSIAGYFASKVHIAIGGGFMAYNYGAQSNSVEAMQYEVISGRRRLGDPPSAESHYRSLGQTVCSFLNQRSQSHFAVGSRQAMNHISTLARETEGMHADSRLIWSAPISARQQMWEEYRRNVQLRQQMKARVIDKTGNVVGEIAAYVNKHTIGDVPFGTTDEIAILPANSCLSASVLLAAAESLRTFPMRVDEAVELLRRLSPDEPPAP